MVIAFIFLIMVSLSAIARGYTQVIQCLNNANYTSNNSTYRADLNAVLSSLSTKIDGTGFYNGSAGQTDKADVIVLCRGDVGLDECRECVQNAAVDLPNSCPYRKEAIIWYDWCMLRYSNETAFGTSMDSPANSLCNQNNATSPDRFKEDLRSLLDNLRDQAASGGSLRKVAGANIKGPDFQPIFALVQCIPDLSQKNCSNCLIGAAAEISKSCDGRRGGRVLLPRCNLRFEIYSFFNETRLQELAPAPVPATPVPQPPSVQSPTGNNDGNTTRTIIIFVVLITACMVLSVFVVILLRKGRKRKPRSQLETVDETYMAESLQYAFSTIRDATNDFSDNNKLGEGGFGAVYKGKLPNGQEIAVKRLSKNSRQGVLEFKNEVLLLARLQHKNLVRLLGFALQGVEKLLVYEFVSNGSLDFFIFDRTSHWHLDWDRRFNIIVGIARGMLYLHEDSRLKIIHRDLKAGNILLDKEMNPKIADFGLAKLFEQDETQGNTSKIVGTYGYMPPEYVMHGQFSVKLDVFSFGVLVLEIISGEKNNCFRGGETAADLPSFAWKNWRNGTGVNMVDPILRTTLGSLSDIMRCIHIGLLCVQDNAADRPIMASIILMLNSFSIALTTPSEPAFYMPSGHGSHVPFLQDSNSSKGYKLAQSDEHLSKHDASITELYPR